MTCSIEICDNIAERSGLCATHAREQRKAEKESLKPKKERKPIAKVGTKNTFECSDGTRVTQAEINHFMYEAYNQQARTTSIQTFYCEGCGKFTHPIAHAHIIPKARCKQIGKTELIWDLENIFWSCNSCNSIAENISSIGITKLLNFQRIKSFLELHDKERFSKLAYTQTEPHKI